MNIFTSNSGHFLQNKILSSGKILTCCEIHKTNITLDNFERCSKCDLYAPSYSNELIQLTKLRSLPNLLWP